MYDLIGKFIMITYNPKKDGIGKYFLPNLKKGDILIVLDSREPNDLTMECIKTGKLYQYVINDSQFNTISTGEILNIFRNKY